MPKRISRKLLVGLGSIVTFGAVGTVSGFGIKSIIDSSLNNSKLNQLTVNSSASGTLTDLPNYNVATEDMFIKTKNLKRFHFGNTQIGQKITPWGWLGVFDDDGGVKSRIALTSWNGEIIWVNEDYKDKEHNVYDMQYDFNSGLLFVLRTDSSNGFYGTNGTYPKVWLEVLKAETGEKYKDGVNNTEFKGLQEKAKQELIVETSLLEGYENKPELQAKTKNLYYLDVTYSHDKKAIMATWMPNYMQMARQTYGGTQEGSLPSFYDVIRTWQESATSFMFGTEKLGNQEVYSRKQRKFDLLRSSGIQEVNDNQNKLSDALIEEGQLQGASTVKASEIYLLTNPFFTTSHDGKAFVMHLIGARPYIDSTTNQEKMKVYHKTIGWEIDLSDTADTSGTIYSLTVGNENLTDKRRYDNIEFWDNGGGFFDLKTDRSWTKAKGWNKEFINANLRVNKNMFDENSIVFAYPYSSSSDVVSNSSGNKYGDENNAMPVFNVTQIWLNKKNAQFKKDQQDSKKFHINYDLGKQIDDYYVTNGPRYGQDNTLNNIYPYPSPGSFDEHNVNHSYNRLISVSPFDNTIVYAAKPNIGESIFGVHNGGLKDSWAGFWLANSWAWDTNVKKKYYHPLIIGNDQSIISDLDRYNSDEMKYMLNNINDLYRDGFTFDISSRMDNNETGTTLLNLYFNQTGRGVNESYNNTEGFQSSKIGLLRDIIYDAGSNKTGQPGSKGWGDSIVPKFPGPWDNTAKKLFATTINKDSFSSIIHSRADLKKWYPRTWSNANFASNMLKVDEVFWIDRQQLSDVAIATQFGVRLTEPAFNGGNKSIDLVSAWKDQNEDQTKYERRFNRLIMKRPTIQAAQTAEENGLGLITNYKLPQLLFDSIVGKEDWEIKINTKNLTLTKVDTVPNTSKQILSAWADSYKMKKIASNTGDIDQNNTGWNQEIAVTEFLDKKKNPAITFGSGFNNNLSRNGVTALRLMLKIIKPTGNNLPNWISGLSESFFNKAYPLESAYDGETTFKDVVKAFADEKARLIDLSEANNAAVGLGNLKIDAYLQLNPKFGNYTQNTEKIYSVPGGKAIIDKNRDNQLIIYKDGFIGNRTIYDQSAINYTDFNQGGFVNFINSSWTQNNDLNGLKNIKVTTNYGNLTDTLVRKNGDNTPLLTFDFKDGTDNLELTPSDQNWFLNHFKNYNRLLGLFVKFEYQKAGNTDWVELPHNSNIGGNIWTDQEIADNLAQNQNKLVLNAVPKDIKQLRFRLVKNPNANDDNLAIDITNFTDTEQKYISDGFRISVQRIVVNKEWITNTTLTNATTSLANITETDITTFETSVLNNIVDVNEKNQVQLVYQFENSAFNLNAAQLVEKIKAKFNDFSGNDQGVFALWDGTNGSQLIKAKFVLKTNNNEFKLITPNSANPTDDDLSNNVKSDIKSKINLGDYITQLTNASIRATIGDQPGKIIAGSIQIPDKSGSIGSGRFNGKSFNDIKNILSTQGISIKFKKQEAGGGNWSSWLDLDQITTYATSKPAIQIGFVFESSKPTNLELDNNTTIINNGDVYTLKLNLPKIVKLPTDEQSIKNAYNANPLSGNTKKLIVDEQLLQQAHATVLQILKTASGNVADYAGLDAVLEFKYQIGNSTFLTADALKNHLATQQDDQSSNALKMKIEIKATSAGQDPEFALEDALKTKEFELLQDNNTIIKKWLHGKNFEDELRANKITVTGSKQNLVYKLGQELNKFDKATGKYTQEELILEYQLLDARDQQVQAWTAGYLPISVQSNVDKIKVRIAGDNSIPEQNKVYVYGPEQEGNRVEETIDLSQIATLIKVDPSWFNLETIVNTKTDIKSVTQQMIQSWEDKIYNRIDQVAAEPTLKNKLKIKYQFTRHNDLESATLANAIDIELRNYADNQHHGIIKLYDKTAGNSSGYQIKATFEKRDPNDRTIKFVDNTGTSIDGEANKDARTGVVNTTNITTTINLTEWIKNLMNSLTVVKTTTAGTIPQGGLVPPELGGAANTNLFAAQTFANIETWLANAQVKFWWRKEETGNDWKQGTSGIKEYDPTKKKLWFALDNQSTNLKLTLGNGFTDLDWNNHDNKNQPITIQLDAPAIINVNPGQLGVIGQYFGGNTKDLKVQVNKITEELNKIKQGLGTGFEQAPLTIMIQVGDEQFYDYKNVATELSQLQDDVTNGIVTARFAIDPSAANQNKFQIINGGDANQQIVNDDGTVKVYINDKNIYTDLQATTPKGTSKKLQLLWQNGISIDAQNGTLTTSNPVRGKGLRIEYTFNTALTGAENEPTGNANEIDTKWTAAQPTSFRAGVDNELFIRIRLVNPNKYVYDNINKKITIDLRQLKSIIELDANWLVQPIAPTEIELSNFNLEQIEVYEQSVFNAIKIAQTLKDKIEIKYDFNGQNNIDKNKLNELIQNYKANNPNKDNLGILQFANANTPTNNNDFAEKIVAKFAVKQQHQSLYELEFIGGDASNQKQLDTSNIFTTIDFSKVVKWLTETNKLVKVHGDLPNVTFTIPDVDAGDDTFNTKTWSAVEQILKGFGIISQYREVLNNNSPVETDWKNSLNDIKKYDQNIGKIGIRFKFDKQKSVNIKLKTNSNPDKIFNGKTQDASEDLELSLDIKLNFKIDQTIVDQTFVNQQDVISGNTKFLEISETDEQTMIRQLIQANVANNEEFNKAGLVVKYKLDKQNDWKSRTDFINDLKSFDTDQQTNKVLFKFEVTNTNDFIVENKEWVLFDPTLQPDRNQWKVKLFINNSNWETNAAKVIVTGTTSGLIWNWNGLTVSDQADGKVGNNDKLQVEFSAKDTAVYDDPDATDNVGDLATGWTTIKPTRIDATTKKLWIRLKAKAGYVYGPSYTDNNQTKTATAHQVDLQIKREILVRPTDLLTSLSLPSGKQFVTDITTTDLEKFVNDGIDRIQPQELQKHVTVKFNFNGSNGLSSQELFEKMDGIIKNNSAPNYGILQLWNTMVGEKIYAYYDVVDPNGDYVLIAANGANAKEPQELITGHIRTKIDLRAIVNDLKNQKIEIESVTSKKNRGLVTIQRWIMPNIKSGTEALNGLTWEQFEQRLKEVGVLIKVRIVKNPDTPANATDWKSLEDLKQYDDTTLKLALRFEVEQQKGDNIVLSVLNDADVDPDQNIDFSQEFQMNIKAPATVVIDPTFITTFTSKDSFRGNTKNLEIIADPEKELIKNIVDKNVQSNADVFKDLNDRLEIQYYLGKNNPDNIPDVVWRSAEELKAFLAIQNTDQETNQIWFRFNIKEINDPNAQVFQIDKTAKVLLQEQINANAKIKIYINETGFTDKINELKAIGSTDDFSIQGLDEWTKTIPIGLKVGYSNETNPTEEDDAKWIDVKPTTLNTDKKLWVRFKVEDGYVYQNAKTTNDRYSNKKSINTDGIKVIIKLQKSWLEQIKISGNTKEPNITEDDVINAIKTAQVLPTGQDDLVELQYKIQGTNNEWVTKDAFTKKLSELAGSKDGQNFILRRQELLVRFNIKNKTDAGGYGLNIDNVNIDNSNRDNYNVQMVDDASNRNESFEGYINLDKLTNFVKDNFHIVGSTSQPRLIINNRDQMNTMFAPYASETLFDILFSTSQKTDGSWDWTNTTQSILSSGQLIDENGLITQHVTIGADKKFAIKFISKDPKYKVYKGNAEEADGYVLDLSDNVKITIEITNPFTAAGKTLGIWTRDNGTGKYFQGEGGFKIVVADKDSLDVESNGSQSAQEFLNQANSIQQNEKDALELVFHYFGQSPLDSEIQRVKAAINDYNDSITWKSFDDIKDPNNGDWSTNQGYRVGDYVAVALRVKKQFATASENAFVLKGDDYSMILPVMQDATQKEKKPGRISGYKIKTSDVDLDNESITLLNMVNPDLPPLDGWTLLSRLSLNPDDKGNYLGVDLGLQFYNDFYKNASGEILISGSGAKLVKRETTGDDIIEDGTYMDAAGKPITDSTGQQVKIYKNKKTKRLSNPKKESTATKTKLLDNLGQGSFRLIVNNNDKKELGLLSLFKNQDLDLKLVASKGQSTDQNLPDFYLDQDKSISLKDIINPKIKYPIENESKISYAWNYDDFLADKIQYKDPNDESNKRPEEGFAQIATIFELIKKIPNQSDQIVKADTIDEAVEKIKKQLEDDFKGQLKFQIERYDSKGNITTQDGNNIYQFQDLKNKDRIVLKIVATEEDLYYVNTERPLIINVDGLTQASPDQSTLQHLRVKQGGVIDGQGSFKVLVSDPNNTNEDDRQILKGWKFMIRVWGTDKKIKIQWTDDPGLVKGLTNGDKVEWKLVSEEGNPVTEAYYNTIALQHKQNADGTINYKFAQVNYKNGDGTYDVVQEGIGDYPDDETKYPEDSGFVISGLKSAVDIFQISKENFAKVMQQLNPTYIGINKQGTIKMEPKYFEDKYWVNSDGELFTKDQPATLKAQDQEETKKEIPLTEFLDNVTFYTHDPVLANYQGGFKFSGNDVNNNNHLTNGDQVWATFDMLNESDENIIINGNEIISSVTLQLADVSGLKEVIDPMSPLWYVLMALAGVVTLGTAALIAFLMTRHKKLKDK